MLDQRLRRWPTLNPLLISVLCLLGKLSLRRGQPLLDPHGNITIRVSTQSPHERISELFTHRCRSCRSSI